MGLEVNLLIHTTNLAELENIVKVLQAFPNLQKTMKIEEDIVELTKKAESLTAEIQILEQIIEQRKAVVQQSIVMPVPIAPVGP